MNERFFQPPFARAAQVLLHRGDLDRDDVRLGASSLSLEDRIFRREQYFGFPRGSFVPEVRVVVCGRKIRAWGERSGDSLDTRGLPLNEFLKISGYGASTRRKIRLTVRAAGNSLEHLARRLAEMGELSERVSLISHPPFRFGNITAEEQEQRDAVEQRSVIAARRGTSFRRSVDSVVVELPKLSGGLFVRRHSTMTSDAERTPRLIYWHEGLYAPEILGGQERRSTDAVFDPVAADIGVLFSLGILPDTVPYASLAGVSVWFSLVSKISLREYERAVA